MAIVLTTNWQNLSSSPGEYFRGWTSGGYQFNYSAMAQARYNIVNGQPRIELRIVMETDNTGGWSGTNRNYRLHFTTETSGPPGDSTTRQDTHSWNVIGYQLYRLYQAGETVDPVYKNVNFGTTHGVHWYYYVGASGTSAIDVWKDVYIPAVAPNTPDVGVNIKSATEIDVDYGTISFGLPNTGTVTLYGGTTTAPTTVLGTYSSTGITTFKHTGLTTGTTYYYRAKANNGPAASGYSKEVAITLDGTKTPKFYGSVSGDSSRVGKLYGSVSGNTTRVIKLYGSENGVAKRIF